MTEERKKQSKLFLAVGILAVIVIAFGAGMFVKGSSEKNPEREQEETLEEMRRESEATKIAKLGTGDSAHFLIGLEGAPGSLLTQPQVREKLEKQAEQLELYTATGAPYTANSGVEIYTDMFQQRH